MLPAIDELTEELEATIKWAIQHGTGSYVLNENNYPYKFGFTLFKGDANQVVMMGGIIPARVAVTSDQLTAALKGEPMPTENPKWNIAWDLRSDLSENICHRKETKELIMGDVDFDTPEEGAKLWAGQLHERVPSWVWVTDEEKEKRDAEIQKEFAEYFEAHCSDDGDCEYKESCKVRWPGGYGLRGCRREHPDDEMWK